MIQGGQRTPKVGDRRDILIHPPDNRNQILSKLVSSIITVIPFSPSTSSLSAISSDMAVLRSESLFSIHHMLPNTITRRPIRRLQYRLSIASESHDD